MNLKHDNLMFFNLVDRTKLYRLCMQHYSRTASRLYRYIDQWNYLL